MARILIYTSTTLYLLLYLIYVWIVSYQTPLLFFYRIREYPSSTYCIIISEDAVVIPPPRFLFRNSWSIVQGNLGALSRVQTPIWCRILVHCFRVPWPHEVNIVSTCSGRDSGTLRLIGKNLPRVGNWSACLSNVSIHSFLIRSWWGHLNKVSYC